MSVRVPISLARTLGGSSPSLAAVCFNHSGTVMVILVFSQEKVGTDDEKILRAVPLLGLSVVRWADAAERQKWLVDSAQEMEDHAAAQVIKSIVTEESTRRLFVLDERWPLGLANTADASQVHVVLRDGSTHRVLFGACALLQDVSRCTEKIDLGNSSKVNVFVCDNRPIVPLVDTMEPIKIAPLQPEKKRSSPNNNSMFSALFSRKDAPVDVQGVLRKLGARCSGIRPGSTVSLFWPPELLVPVLVDDNASQAEREQLHCSLLLPHRNPFPSFLRTDLSSGSMVSPWCFDVARHGQKWESNLVCVPHAQVTSKKLSIAGSTTSVVIGKYDYYHYQVDGFPDEGWGCAYRSMQTVLSWFQHQMFVRDNKPMPGILQIQQILASVDPDKQAKPRFVGSKDWIGSFEVMLVLQHFVPELECRIQRLEQGIELETSPQIHRMLHSHFQRGGPPVMIGGSSYAHTILGIDVNIKTGEAQYLVLDPHYTATTTVMKTVVQKGWCGWKIAKEFFKPDSWYNLCIPCSYAA